MKYLLDTNILLRMVQHNHPMQKVAISAVQTLFAQGNELCITSQNLIEFWSVATRPSDVNGLGFTNSEANFELSEMKRIFTLCPDTPDILSEWEKLVVKYQVMGKQTHDTRLVATMLVHQITHLLTFNTKDFKRFMEITAISPSEIA